MSQTDARKGGSKARKEEEKEGKEGQATSLKKKKPGDLEKTKTTGLKKRPEAE